MKQTDHTKGTVYTMMVAACPSKEEVTTMSPSNQPLRPLSQRWFDLLSTSGMSPEFLKTHFTIEPDEAIYGAAEAEYDPAPMEKFIESLIQKHRKQANAGQ